MTEDEFWDLVAPLGTDADRDRATEELVELLSKKPMSDIHEFQDWVAAKLYALDGSNWWDDDDNHSGDSFLYARCAVVAGGRTLYERVLSDPSQMLRQDYEFEALIRIARKAAERHGGAGAGHQSPVSWETWSNEAQWREQWANNL